MYNSITISGWSLKIALWCFTMIPSQEICTYTRGKSHHSFPQDIIHVRLGNMNPCHPFCFFLYFQHKENICFVAVQEQLPEYLLPLAQTSTTIVVKQHIVVCIPQHHQTCTCVSTLSPTSPTPMHTQCIQTAYFHSNSNTYITPTFCFLFSVDPHSFTSHSGPDTPVSSSTRVKTKSEFS